MHYSHRLSQARIHQIVGWFMVVPVLILVMIAVIVGQNENLFQDQYDLTTLFSDGYGLKAGYPVMLLGIQVGRVSKVEITEQNDAKITMRILKKFQDKIRANSIAKIGKTGGFFGDPQIEIMVGNKSQPVVPTNGHIEAEEPFSVTELMAQAKPMLESVQKVVNRVAEITIDVQKSLATGQDTLLHVQEASARFPAVFENVQQTTASVRETAMTITKDIPAMTASAKKSVSRIGDAIEDIKSSTSRVPDIVADLKEVTQEVKTVVHDTFPELVQSAQGTVQDVNDIMLGAKTTFPMSMFMAKGRSTRSHESRPAGLRSLRQDDLGSE